MAIGPRSGVLSSYERRVRAGRVMEASLSILSWIGFAGGRAQAANRANVTTTIVAPVHFHAVDFSIANTLAAAPDDPYWTLVQWGPNIVRAMVGSVTIPLAARRCAAAIVILAAVLWWHRWAPLLIVVVFAVWVIFHKWLESERSEGLQRAWRRVWPPATLVLVVLIVGGTALYSASNHALEAKIMPIALNVLAGFMVVGGTWRRVSAS